MRWDFPRAANALIWDYFAQVEQEEQPQEQTDAEA